MRAGAQHCGQESTGLPLPRDEAGFSLVEVVIAMAVFAVLSTSVLGIVLQAQRTTGAGLRRTVAGDLVTRQIEAARTADVASLAVGRSSSTQTVNGVPYTITQDVGLSAADAPEDLCALSSASALSYKLVTVRVTWPNMGNVTAPRADTLRAVGFGTDNVLTTATATVKLQGADGPVSDVPVTMRTSAGALVNTLYTDADGCAVFAGLTPATGYVASVDATGHVTVGSPPARATSVGVTGLAAAQVTPVTLTYAAERTLALALSSPGGAALPTGLPVVLTGSLGSVVRQSNTCTTAGSGCLSATPGTFQHLYPDTYTVQVGACTGLSAASGKTSLSGVLDLRPEPGTATGDVTVNLGQVNATVTTSTGTAVVGRTVTFTRQSQSGETCGTEVYTLATNGQGRARLTLPYGQWQVSCPQGTGSGTVSVSRTVDAGTRTRSAPLVVTS